MADEFNPSVNDQDIEEILNFVREKNSEKYKIEEEKATLEGNKRERINNSSRATEDIKNDVSKALRTKNKGQTQLMGNTTEVAAMFSDAKPFADTTSVMISDVINTELDNKQSTAKSVAKSNSPMAYTRDDIDIKELFGNDLTYSKEIDISSIVSRIDSFQPIGDIFDLAIHEIESRDSLNDKASDSRQTQATADDEYMEDNTTPDGEEIEENENSVNAEDEAQQSSDLTESPDNTDDDVTAYTPDGDDGEEIEENENSANAEDEACQSSDLAKSPDNTDDDVTAYTPDGDDGEEIEENENSVNAEDEAQQSNDLTESPDNTDDDVTAETSEDDMAGEIEEVYIEDEKTPQTIERIDEDVNIEEEQSTNDIIAAFFMNNASEEESENVEDITYNKEESVGVSQDTYGDLLISSLLSGRLGQIDINETDSHSEDISNNIIEQASKNDEQTSDGISEDMADGTPQEDLTNGNSVAEEIPVDDDTVTETDVDKDKSEDEVIFDNISDVGKQAQDDLSNTIEKSNYSEESPIMSIFTDDNVNDDINNTTADSIDKELPFDNDEPIKNERISINAEITEEEADVEDNQEDYPEATAIDNIDGEDESDDEDEKERKSKLFIILPIIAVLLIAMAVFAYCMLLPKDKQDNDKNDASSIAPPVESVVEYTVESVAETSEPEVSSKVVEPEPEVYTGEYSRLTGLPIDDDDLNTRPIAVMINNIEYAQPLLGISKADVVYECIVEGGITRILAVFGTPSDVHTIGSVRSARPDFVYLADGLDAVYFHIGTSTQARDLLNTGIVTSFDLGYYSAWSWRDNYRMNALGYEHSLVTSGETLADCISSNGVRETSDTDKGMKFGDKSPVLKGEKAKNLNVKFSSYKSTSFSYNSKKKAYTVEQFGSTQYDAEYGVDNTVTNVITVCTDVYQLDDEGHMSFDTIGSGKGYYMSNGKIIDITWSKESADEPMRYYTSSGKELTMMRGKTYVCIVPNDADISYWS